MRFTFLVEVEVGRIEGKFASRDDIGGQILEALESGDPGSFVSENDGQYETVTWDVEEQEQPKRHRR